MLCSNNKDDNIYIIPQICRSYVVDTIINLNGVWCYIPEVDTLIIK